MKKAFGSSEQTSLSLFNLITTFTKHLIAFPKTQIRTDTTSLNTETDPPGFFLSGSFNNSPNSLKDLEVSISP